MKTNTTFKEMNTNHYAVADPAMVGALGALVDAYNDELKALEGRFNARANDILVNAIVPRREGTCKKATILNVAAIHGDTVFVTTADARGVLTEAYIHAGIE